MFFDGTVTSDNYLEIITNQVVSQLQQQFYSNDFYFQKDGASPHYSREVRK